MAQHPPGTATADFTRSVVGKPITEAPPAAPEVSIADPAPLGLAAFALTTFLLSLSNAHVWPSTTTALALAMAYGGAGQLLAGMWEFKRNNTFGATAFSSYGAFWIGYFIFVMFIAKSVPSADIDATVGTFLMAWGIFTAYMTVASLRVSVAIVIVFVLLTVTFFLLAIGAYEASAAWTKAGGWCGVATAAAAWYASFAGVTNSTFKKVVLPVVPLAR